MARDGAVRRSALGLGAVFEVVGVPNAERVALERVPPDLRSFELPPATPKRRTASVASTFDFWKVSITPSVTAKVPAVPVVTASTGSAADANARFQFPSSAVGSPAPAGSASSSPTFRSSRPTSRSSLAASARTTSRNPSGVAVILEALGGGPPAAVFAPPRGTHGCWLPHCRGERLGRRAFAFLLAFLPCFFPAITTVRRPRHRRPRRDRESQGLRWSQRARARARRATHEPREADGRRVDPDHERQISRSRSLHRVACPSADINFYAAASLKFELVASSLSGNGGCRVAALRTARLPFAHERPTAHGGRRRARAGSVAAAEPRDAASGVPHTSCGDAPGRRERARGGVPQRARGIRAPVRLRAVGRRPGRAASKCTAPGGVSSASSGGASSGGRRSRSTASRQRSASTAPSSTRSSSATGGRPRCSTSSPTATPSAAGRRARWISCAQSAPTPSASCARHATACSPAHAAARLHGERARAAQAGASASQQGEYGV